MGGRAGQVTMYRTVSWDDGGLRHPFTRLPNEGVQVWLAGLAEMYIKQQERYATWDVNNDGNGTAIDEASKATNQAYCNDE